MMTFLVFGFLMGVSLQICKALNVYTKTRSNYMRNKPAQRPEPGNTAIQYASAVIEIQTIDALAVSS